jgi:putative Ig domain-containing protein
MMRERSAAGLHLYLVFTMLLGAISSAQQPPDPTNLSLDAVTLPKASPRHEYKFQFQAHGGIPPMKYVISQGSLPTGMKLGEDGLLAGTPTTTGEYKFTVTATDSSNPPQKAFRAYVLRVSPPMVMEWKRYAHVTGNRIDGSIVISNNTEDDFDFTFVVLAVAENGRAVAIGYQHFPLKNGVDSLEIPFGETLSRGNYVVHVDAVGELAAKDQIYRTRLQTKEKLQIQVGP